MDSATFSMLRDLPDDLSALGWEVHHQSEPRRGGKRYAAVYVRPFDQAIDENPTTAFHVVQIHGRSFIRVSSATWQASSVCRGAGRIARYPDARR